MPSGTFLLHLLILSKTLLMTVQGNQAHTPVKITWQLIDGLSAQVLNQTSSIRPPRTWWPDLFFCFRDLNSGYSSTQPTLARRYGFYACPFTHNFKKCGSMADGYCKKWDCVTSNDGEWKWRVTKPDSVRFSFVNAPVYGRWLPQAKQPCSPDNLDFVRVSFTERAFTQSGWVTGLSWGLVFWDYGSHVPSILIIKQQLESLPTQSLGPSPILKAPPPLLPSPSPYTPPPPKSSQASSNSSLPFLTSSSSAPKDPL